MTMGGASLSHLELEVIRLCGLSEILAPGLLRRALAAVDAQSPPSAEELLRALPQVEMRMKAYLPHDEVRKRSAEIRNLLRGGLRPSAKADLVDH